MLPRQDGGKMIAFEIADFVDLDAKLQRFGFPELKAKAMMKCKRAGGHHQAGS